MRFEKKQYKVENLAEAWNSGSLARNEEYQRGEAWTLQQKQALVDSLLRDYPIPPLFLQMKTMAGLGGKTSDRWEIVDGQQRILALRDFAGDKFPLLDPTDKRLKLPASMRKTSVPWANRTCSGLDAAIRSKFAGTLIDVYEISHVSSPDEVRDLFIRLQSGTALTRQQIRDAWPGNLGVCPSNSFSQAREV
ncbi:MAG: DUF262 domain-containing protein [Ignavibacteriae bacterium]|nr:DUF262 domain-containing protein [Ignavibacteriota bacterium]